MQVTSNEKDRHPYILIDLYSLNTPNKLVKSLYIYYDIFNQEFYSILPDLKYEVRAILPTMDMIIEFIHEEIHITYHPNQIYEHLLSSFPNDGENVITEAMNENEVASYSNFLNAIKNQLIPKDEMIYSTESPTSSNVNIDPKDVDWKPNQIILESKETLENNGEVKQSIVTLRIGKYYPLQSLVIAKIKSQYINGKLSFESGNILPIEEKYLSSFKELIDNY